MRRQNQKVLPINVPGTRTHSIVRRRSKQLHMGACVKAREHEEKTGGSPRAETMLPFRSQRSAVA